MFAEPRENCLCSLFSVFTFKQFIFPYLLLAIFIQALSLYASYTYTPLLHIAIYISSYLFQLQFIYLCFGYIHLQAILISSAIKPIDCL